MARYLNTIPSNLGFFALGSVQSYPTGGTGPTAFGPNSYFGSDPVPQNPGDSLYTAVDLGSFTSPLSTITLKNTHGGLTRKVSTFYKFKLFSPRSVQFTQNYSQFAYTENTNRNTLLAFYKITDGTKRVELPINNQGYVYTGTGVDYDTDDSTNSDYPNTRLEPGEYSFVITNDIRFIETSYSISITVGVTDWRFVTEPVDIALDFRFVYEPATETADFGGLTL